MNVGGREGEDGVLTGLEAASLDLRGTRLVVLSACASGVGEVRSGDGVRGLQRAFALAGAESSVVALFSVEDAAAHALMSVFYQRLAAGEARADALRAAQIALLRDPATAHPHAWAAFVLSRDPGPLEPTADALPRARACRCATPGARPSDHGGASALFAAAIALAARRARRRRPRR